MRDHLMDEEAAERFEILYAWSEDEDCLRH